MKILAAIASYGTANDRHLARIVHEYRSMPFDVDIVVLSNVAKAVPPNVELIVGLPTQNPWSLPFAHKKVFANRVSKYDIFIYSEDDILITEKNVRAFLKLSSKLPASEIPGFLRFEVGQDGKRSYPEFHVNFRWEPSSLRSRDEYTLAFFTNEHAGCYILTQIQLQRAIDSGGFLVEPHQGKYDLACSAATDPYTQCGLEKLICISHLEDFLVHHLSDKYAGKYGLHESEFNNYVRSLLGVMKIDGALPPFNTDSISMGGLYSKNYYEPLRPELMSLIPSEAKSVLSLGCGWGETESYLARAGRRVVAVALDPATSLWAGSKGVEVVSGDRQTVQKKLANEVFDCLLVSNILHLESDPARLLASFTKFLGENSYVIACIPNLPLIKVAWKRIHDHQRCKVLGDFCKSRVHIASHRVVGRWFRDAGLKVERFVDDVPPRLQRTDRLTLGLLRPLLAAEISVVGRVSRELRKPGAGSFHDANRSREVLVQQ
jgi:SAM-dependent methyltransferase